MKLRTLIIASCIASVTSVHVPAEATFPGQNGRIVFEDNYQLVTLNPDGTDPTQITDLPGESLQPSVSPDGKRIAFANYPWDGDVRKPDIYIINTDGSGLRNLTETAREEWSPTWSPGGKRIAYMRPVRHIDQIFIERVDGVGKPRQVSNFKSDCPCHGHLVEWSPLGDEFAVIREAGKPVRWNIQTLSLRTGKVRTITGGSERSVDTLSWSPDGKRLVFSDWADALWKEPEQTLCYGSAPWPAYSCDVDIFTINADGTNEVQLTDAPSFDSFPAWSPDGKQIVYVSDSGTHPNFQDLWVMDADGSNQRRIYTTTFDAWFPTWGRLP